MAEHGIRQWFRPSGLPLQLAAGSGAGLLLGLALQVVSPLLVLGALAAAAFLFAALKRPELSLLGIVVATSTIMFEEQLPLIPIGLGSLHIPDILLIGSLGLIAVRWLVEPGFKIVRTPLDWPLLIFFGVALISTSIAVFRSSVELEAARRAIRIVAYYLSFFVVTNLVRQRRQVDLLLNGIFLLAAIVAVAMLAQYVVGTSGAFLPGRVESLGTQGVTFGDVTRILPPGWSIVLISFVAIACILVLNEFKLPSVLRFLQLGLLGIALVMTFLRSYWAGLAVALCVLAFLVRGPDRRRLIGWGLAAVVLSAAVLLAAFARPGSQVGRLVAGASDRLGTLWSAQTLNEASLEWRYIENEYAIRQIVSHPLLGLGLGARYRPFDSRLDVPGMAWDARGFIHNGHLWILLDTGLIGYLALMWLSVAFLVHGFRFWRTVADVRLRGVVLGFCLVYLAVLLAAALNSTFMQWRWTPVIGIMMGANEVILGQGGASRS